jgi:hypothetical protein
MVYCSACIIYGWEEESYDQMIDSDWIDDSNLSITFRSMEGNSVTDLYYGITCYIDNETQQILISESSKKEVESLYNSLVEQGFIDSNSNKLGFYSVVMISGACNNNETLNIYRDEYLPEKTPSLTVEDR